MDETHDKKDEQKTEFGLKDSDFASSTPKPTEKTEQTEKKTLIVENNVEPKNTDKKLFVPKKGFLTLPISDILHDFLDECKSLAKDNEWICKSLSGFFGVNALLSFATFYLRGETAMGAGVAPNVSGTQALIFLIIFVLMIIATAGMINVVVRKVLFKENVDMFLYDKTVVRLLKKTILYILAVIGVAVLFAMVLSIVLLPLIGPVGMMISSILTVVIALYVSARLLLLLPATVDGGDVSLRKAYKWTGGYASSLVAIVLIYGILYSLFLSLVTMVVSLTHVGFLVILVNVVFSLINQVLAMTLFAKIYQFFKKNNMLG